MKTLIRDHFNKSELSKLTTIFLTFILTLTLAGCGGGYDRNSVGQQKSEKPLTGSITIGWYAPTVNDDGTPLNDLSGYIIYYGTTSNNYTQSINIGNVTNYTVNNLQEGNYYFVVTAYDTSGNESDLSSELSVYITQG